MNSLFGWLGTGACTSEHAYNKYIGIALCIAVVAGFIYLVVKSIKKKKIWTAIFLFMLGLAIFAYIALATIIMSACS